MKTLNLNTIEKLKILQIEGESDVISDLISIYQNDSSDRIKTILEGLDHKNFALAAKKAHSLKSSAAGLGAERLHDICERIESQKGSSDALLLRNELTEEAKRVDEELAKLLESRKRLL